MNKFTGLFYGWRMIGASCAIRLERFEPAVAVILLTMFKSFRGSRKFFVALSKSEFRQYGITTKARRTRRVRIFIILNFANFVPSW